MMKKNTLHYQMLIAVCLLVAAMVLSTSRAEKIKKHSQAALFFDMTAQVEVCYDRSQKDKLRRSIELVRKRWEEIEWRMNTSGDHSDLAKINHSTRQPVRISDDTYFVLLESVRLSQLTSGAFDVTVWPLVKLWQQSAQQDIFPSEEELQRIRKNVGTRHIRLLKDSQVKLLNKDTQISVGGVVSGYAADESARILRKYGFENFLINIGGSFFSSGMNCAAEPWTVTIHDPGDAARVLNTLQIGNTAMAVAGRYPPLLAVGGERYSSIIDPATGHPQNKTVSAVVIAPSAVEAQALAIALCVMDPERSRSLIDRQGTGWASSVLTHESERFTQYDSKNFPFYRVLRGP